MGAGQGRQKFALRLETGIRNQIFLEKPEVGILNSYNHLSAFYLTCFARVCEIFTAVVS